MKQKSTAFIFFLIISTFGFSQNLSLSVIPAQGGFDKTENISLEWTLGESIIETVSKDQIILTQGFHQSFIQRILNVYETPFNILIYPNPAYSQFNVHLDIAIEEQLFLRLFDIHGRGLKEASVYAGVRDVIIDVSNLSSGLYLLKISDLNGSVFESHKIIKY